MIDLLLFLRDYAFNIGILLGLFAGYGYSVWCFYNLGFQAGKKVGNTGETK